MGQSWKPRLERLRYLDGLVAALVAVSLGFLLGFLGILKVRPTDTGSGEAFAALAAAVVGIGGAQIGQATGIRRGGPEPLAHRDHTAVDAALIAIGLVVIVWAITLFWVNHDRSAAAATLVLAALGVVPIHLFHERRSWNGGDVALGVALIIAGLGLGIGGIMLISDHAEALAALGSALVASGGTLLSHARGLHRRTQVPA
jgi:hypothetical protein